MYYICIYITNVDDIFISKLTFVVALDRLLTSQYHQECR